MEEEILEEEIQVQEENYIVKADLSDYYTKEETNTLLGGKQNSITSTSKLDSDLVDDTNKTNLFVTSTEKSTWNGKQDTLAFDSTPTLESYNPVTSNGIALALQNAGGNTKPMYLGKITEHNSTDTAIDLNSLDVGYYMITHISRNANLYLQATYKDNVIRGTYNPYYYGMCQNDVLYLRLEKKITDDLSSGTVVGYFTYTDFYETDRNIAYYMKSIQINNNNISISGGSSIEYQIATRNTTQTISGKKTFTTLPESSVIPTTNNQLVNKTYVDGLIGNINTVLATLTTPATPADGGDEN